MKNNNKQIMVMGDIHGEFGYLNTIINKHKPDILLQCGDFGYWPQFEEFSIEKIKPQNTKIYFCDGNHEDHFSLGKFSKEPTEIVKNVWYMPRGSVLVLNDGRKVMFCGGARSIDCYARTIMYDWFPEEEISYQDLDHMLNFNDPIDIVISHTCPYEFNEYLKQIPGFDIYEGSKFKDNSQHALSVVLEKYHPSLWYFGHFHKYFKKDYQGTTFIMLDRDFECMNYTWV